MKKKIDMTDLKNFDYCKIRNVFAAFKRFIHNHTVIILLKIQINI